MRHSILTLVFAAALATVAACGDAQRDDLADAPVDSSTGALQAAPSDLFVVSHSGKYLDIEGASQVSGARLIQYQSTGGANQRFALLSRPAGLISLVATHSGRCLEVAGSSLDNGAAVVQGPCTFGPNQTFLFVSRNDGTFQLSPSHSNKCLDVKDGSTANVAPVHQWTCTGTTNQLFRRVGSTGPTAFYLSAAEAKVMTDVGLTPIPQTVTALRSALTTKVNDLNSTRQLDMVRLQGLMNHLNEAIEMLARIQEQCQPDPTTLFCVSSIRTTQDRIAMYRSAIADLTAAMSTRSDQVAVMEGILQQTATLSGSVAVARLS